MKKNALRSEVFEYIVFKLLNWLHTAAESENHASSPRVKFLKFMFLTSVINKDLGNNLLDISNNSDAMQYGHTGSDIYNMMNSHDIFSC